MIVQFAEQAGSRRSLLFERRSAGAARGVGECETAIESDFARPSSTAAATTCHRVQCAGLPAPDGIHRHFNPLKPPMRIALLCAEPP
jgi:hypothetical protein